MLQETYDNLVANRSSAVNKTHQVGTHLQTPGGTLARDVSFQHRLAMKLVKVRER